VCELLDDFDRCGCVQFSVSYRADQLAGGFAERVLGAGAHTVLTASPLPRRRSTALAHQRSEGAAITDPLTGVANRRGLERAVSDRRGRRSLAALMIDVDDLKGVNDRLGHAAGDEPLLLVAAAVGGVLRDGDVLARLGGDEFAALIFDADKPSVCAVAERMLASVDAARTAKLRPRISIGIAGAGADDTLEVVLRQADAALYEAKQQGGMRFVVGR
jgi:diguanylate cyclase (GGDEF)-like protein